MSSPSCARALHICAHRARSAPLTPQPFTLTETGAAPPATPRPVLPTGRAGRRRAGCQWRRCRCSARLLLLLPGPGPGLTLLRDHPPAAQGGAAHQPAWAPRLQCVLQGALQVGMRRAGGLGLTVRGKRWWVQPGQMKRPPWRVRLGAGKGSRRAGNGFPCDVLFVAWMGPLWSTAFSP